MSGVSFDVTCSCGWEVGPISSLLDAEHLLFAHLDATTTTPPKGTTPCNTATTPPSK